MTAVEEVRHEKVVVKKERRYVTKRDACTQTLTQKLWKQEKEDTGFPDDAH